MPEPATCAICGLPIPPRRRNTCSVECKRKWKSAYDAARYIEKRDEILARVTASTSTPEWKKRKQAYDADYRERNREHRLRLKREHSRTYSRLHREAARLRGQARRAAKEGNGTFLVTERDLRRIEHRYRHRCAECFGVFTDENPREWDHVIPIRRGGRHSVGNLLPLCRACNRSKLVRLRSEWRAGKVVSVRALPTIDDDGRWDNLKLITA